MYAIRSYYADIAGQGIANPIATINSVAMMLQYVLNQPESSVHSLV